MYKVMMCLISMEEHARPQSRVLYPLKLSVIHLHLAVLVCGEKSTTTTTNADYLDSVMTTPSSEKDLSELLVLPKPKRKTGRTRNEKL